jgi:ABC-type branched-subunit amino acid transport system ATPase component
MRRLVEMACVTGVDARLLLLDEPTAGIAQREVEAFGPLLRSLRDALDATVLIIEHDVPLMMRLADRIYVMASGEVIASGTPKQISDDPKVAAAYLGTDERLIARSGAIVPRPQRRSRKRSVVLEEGAP